MVTKELTKKEAVDQKAAEGKAGLEGFRIENNNGSNHGYLNGSIANEGRRNNHSPLHLLDSINRAIIRKLQGNPEISQSDLAKAVSLSQSSIALRLAKLLASGLIIDPIGIDYAKLGLSMARVDVSAKDSRSVFEWARKCPLCVNASSVLNDSNVSLYFVTEDLDAISQIIDSHLHKIEGVTKTECKLISRWAWQDSLHLRLDLEIERAETPPCGISPFCTKCPKNPKYEGKVWPTGGIEEFRKENWT